MWSLHIDFLVPKQKRRRTLAPRQCQFGVTLYPSLTNFRYRRYLMEHSNANQAEARDVNIAEFADWTLRAPIQSESALAHQLVDHHPRVPADRRTRHSLVDELSTSETNKPLQAVP